MIEIPESVIWQLHELVLTLTADAREMRVKRGELEPGSHNRASYLSGKEFAFAEASRGLFKITRHLPQVDVAQAVADTDEP
jgi:hypothetical protein